MSLLMIGLTSFTILFAAAVMLSATRVTSRERNLYGSKAPRPEPQARHDRSGRPIRPAAAPAPALPSRVNRSAPAIAGGRVLHPPKGTHITLEDGAEGGTVVRLEQLPHGTTRIHLLLDDGRSGYIDRPDTEAPAPTPAPRVAAPAKALTTPATDAAAPVAAPAVSEMSIGGLVFPIGPRS